MVMVGRVGGRLFSALPRVSVDVALSKASSEQGVGGISLKIPGHPLPPG
jgi:hypothetical protein